MPRCGMRDAGCGSNGHQLACSSIEHVPLRIAAEALYGWSVYSCKSPNRSSRPAHQLRSVLEPTPVQDVTQWFKERIKLDFV